MDYAAGEEKEAMLGFFHSILNASQKRAQPIFEKIEENPQKWQGFLKRLLPYFKEIQSGQSKGFLDLKGKVERAEPLNERDMHFLKIIAQQKAVWDMIGLKPKDLSKSQAIIIANSACILTGFRFDYSRSYKDLYHLTCAMGFLFNVNSNNLRNGIYEYFTERMEKYAKKKRMPNPKKFVAGMQSSLLELRNLFRQINNIRNTSK